MEPFPMKIRKNNQASWADSRTPLVNVPPDGLTPVQRRDSSLQGLPLGLLSRQIHFLIVCVSMISSAVLYPIKGKTMSDFSVCLRKESIIRQWGVIPMMLMRLVIIKIMFQVFQSLASGITKREKETYSYSVMYFSKVVVW